MVAIVLDANYGVQTNHEEIWQTCEICSRLTPKKTSTINFLLLKYFNRLPNTIL